MSDNPLTFKNILAGVVTTILGGVLLAIIIQDARFDPQRNPNSDASSRSSTEIPSLPTPVETIPFPSPTPTQPSEPEPMISGVWVGTYTCSKGMTGVTVDIAQTGNVVIADFSLYPVSANPNVPSGMARYEGDFNSTSRRMSFPRGTWINKPASFWTAFGFHGQFDQKLETFDGRMDHHSCTTINLTRKDD